MFNSSTDNALVSAENVQTNSLSELAKTPISSKHGGTQLVFISTDIANYEVLAQNTLAEAKVVLLDSTRDGILQITEALERYDRVSGVHIVSHGRSGELKLGSASVDLKTLNQRGDELTNWSKTLAPDADILLYACNTAEGESGRAFVTALAKLTDADIAASTDLTGSANLGGDWNLEVNSGAIESSVIFQPVILEAYEGVFANFAFTTFGGATGLQLNGSSALAGTALQLTPDAPFRAGSAYYATPLAITGSTSFQTQFQFRISDSGTATDPGGDGFTFVLQNSAAGAAAVGAPGGNVGYDNSDGGAPVGRSLAIEFDTAGNAWDPNDNHIAVLRDGNGRVALATAAAGLPDLNSGSLINAWIDYSGSSDRLNVYLSTAATRPTTPTLSYTVDLAAVVGSQAFVGFTAGTGLFSNAHAITSWSLSSSDSVVPETSQISLKDSNTIFVSEGAGNAIVTVARTGSASDRVTLEYTLNAIAGGATAGLDYIQPTFNGRANTGQVVFEVGETEKTFAVPIVEDGLLEGNETFSVGIQNPSSGSLSAPRTLLITIIDNDIANTVSVSSPAISVSEGASNATITVQRSGDLSVAASVDFTTTNSSATAGADYTAASGTLTFAPGQSSRTITVPILEDSLTESNETFTVTLRNPTGTALGAQATTTVTILDNDLALGSFTRQDVFSRFSLSQPIAIDWTPGGRYMLIAEKGGAVRISDNGVLRPEVLLNLSGEVGNVADRGMLGIAVHPQFFTGNPYLYVTYTIDPPETAGRTDLARPDGEGNRPAQLSRFTLDPATMQVVPGSRVILLGTNSTWAFTSGPDVNSTGNRNVLPSGIATGTGPVTPSNPATLNGRSVPAELIEVGFQDNDPDTPGIQNRNIRDYIATDSLSHTIGAVHFGPDGYLYVSTGDGTSYNFMDPRTVRVQDPSNLSGKMLRIDPITGDGVSGNPFYDPADPDSNRSKVFYTGLRNPFRFTFDPVTQYPVIGDVGWVTWEEINTGVPGSNFGWPFFEGPAQNVAYGALPQAQAFYNNGNRNSFNINPAVLPLLAPSHGAPDSANAIMVGDFLNRDTLIYGDVNNGTIYAATFDAARRISGVRVFDSGVNFLVDAEVGPDGLLYGASIGTGTIIRWVPA
ncbi:DUF4347 domain-containing protein [Leptolyngbya ohadii]|uniref:DUF4347 domain-containing protein n=1 Tax=Leptolyngbya ohadii TaxID=1962290 RepID=UPI000B59F3F6|nr:DUF4347 domain-containing protein [Leptolyngbya ohadii]